MAAQEKSFPLLIQVTSQHRTTQTADPLSGAKLPGIASAHFEETTTEYWYRKAYIQLWHSNWQTVSTLRITTVKCATGYDAFK